MKKFISYLVLVQLALLLSCRITAQFQPAPVVRSQEKTIVNGRLYYIHTVQKGQTLYSISKAYDVTQEEIKTANPQVDVVNLVEGLAIRIPAVSGLNQAAVYPEHKEDFYEHKVKHGQTVYSLSKKYRVDQELIYQYNPWAREGIRPDQTIWIPRKKEMQVVTVPEKSDDLYFYYTSKEKDTLYSISKLYGVSVAEIVEINPELRNGLKPGQILKIPKPPLAATDLLNASDSLNTETVPCMAPEQPITFEVALMLPFFASFKAEDIEIPSDSVTEEGANLAQQRQQGLRGRNFAEFYEGFMLAVDSLKRTGFSVNLHVYDTEHDTNKIKKIVRDLTLIQPDLIIGPVYGEDVNITGRLARYQNIPLISPLSTRPSLVSRNPNIIQVIPSRESESYALANYLKQFNKGRIILLRGTDSISLKNSWRFKNYLSQNMPVDLSGNPLYFKDYRLNDSLMGQLGKVLSKEEENLLVVFSDNEAEVSILINRLIQRTALYPVVLFGMPSWQSWTNIDLTFFHSLQLHLITPFFTDYYNSPQIRKFLVRSRMQLGYEPYEISQLGYNFSMLGYDIGSYFLSALKLYGKNFLTCIDQVKADQLLTRYHFQKEGEGGYVNNSFNLILYRNDFTIEKIAVVNGEPVVPEYIVPPLTLPTDTIPQIQPLQ